MFGILACIRLGNDYCSIFQARVRGEPGPPHAADPLEGRRLRATLDRRRAERAPARRARRQPLDRGDNCGAKDGFWRNRAVPRYRRCRRSCRLRIPTTPPRTAPERSTRGRSLHSRCRTCTPTTDSTDSSTRAAACGPAGLRVPLCRSRRAASSGRSTYVASLADAERDDEGRPNAPQTTWNRACIHQSRHRGRPLAFDSRIVQREAASPCGDRRCGRSPRRAARGGSIRTSGSGLAGSLRCPRRKLRSCGPPRADAPIASSC